MTESKELRHARLCLKRAKADLTGSEADDPTFPGFWEKLARTQRRVLKWRRAVTELGGTP